MTGLTIIFVGMLAVLFAPRPASARNDKYLLPISAALQSKDAAEAPDGSVKFYFGNQETPDGATKLGSFLTHQRSTTRPADDYRACNVAFLKGLVALQKRAQQLGANAVVHIASYYKNDTLSSATEFECHAGVAAHVMLKGDFVKVGGK
jgi:hypothetical protein